MPEERASSSAFRDLVSEMLASGLRFRFQARGRSMLPVIKDGEILHVAPVPPGKLKVGDIVLFSEGTQLKAHRIVRRKQNSFRTRGDSGLEMDNAIRGEQFMGRIVAKERAESGGVISLGGCRARLRFLAQEATRKLSRRVRGAFSQALPLFVFLALLAPA